MLARIHRDTIGRLRKEIEPVSPAVFLRFLTHWQHASAEVRRRDDSGLLEVVEQLQGFEAAAGAWESEILPLRIGGYSSPNLDALCVSGEIAWGRFSRRPTNGDSPVAHTPLARNAPISFALREALAWLVRELVPNDGPTVGAAGEVLEYLSQKGASFASDIVTGTWRLPPEVEDALWQLTAAGLVSADGFGAVRRLLNGVRNRAGRLARRRNWPQIRIGDSRWVLLQGGGPDTEQTTEARAFQLLLRYGIVFPEVLAREAMAPRWRELLQVYRRAEARGEIRGGRFVAGFMGEQFALPEAVEQLRHLRRTEPEGRLTEVSACDPLNLAGILTPGAKVPAQLGNRLVLRGRLPIASLLNGELRWHAEVDDLT